MKDLSCYCKMFQHEFKKIKLQNQKQASKDKIKNASSLWIKCLRLCGLLRLQELYIFLLHFIQCFHGLPVFGPQVLEQGHIQLWQFGLKTESGLFATWPSWNVDTFGNHILLHFSSAFPILSLATAMLS